MNERLELAREFREATGIARGLAYRVRAAIEQAYNEGLVQYGEIEDIRSATSRIIAADIHAGYLVTEEEKIARHSEGTTDEAESHQG